MSVIIPKGYACVLTFDSKKIDIKDDDLLCRELEKWCDDHKDGDLQLLDSGMVIVPNYKRPIKARTADKLGISQEDRVMVYSVADWHYGYSIVYQCQTEHIYKWLDKLKNHRIFELKLISYVIVHKALKSR